MTSLIISENVPVVSSDRRLGLSSVSHCSCALVYARCKLPVVVLTLSYSYRTMVEGILDSPLVGLCLRINNSGAV